MRCTLCRSRARARDYIPPNGALRFLQLVIEREGRDSPRLAALRSKDGGREREKLEIQEETRLVYKRERCRGRCGLPFFVFMYTAAADAAARILFGMRYINTLMNN